MAGRSDNHVLSIPMLQAYPLVRQYIPAGLAAGVFNQELRDTALTYLNLDTLCEMEEEGLRRLVRPPLDGGESGPDCAGGEQDGEGDEEVLIPRTAEECVVLSVDEEGLAAKMTLLPPPDGVAAPGSREMMRVLYKRKITRGVRVEFIDRLAERPVYDRPFRIAEAQAPVNGQDGSVTYYFDTSVDLRPRAAADGTVDYKDLDFVKSVTAGELLCEITPAAPGVDGMNIYGQPIPASAGRPPKVRCGANTVLSEDGLQIRAACDGQVFLRDDSVEVSQVLSLDKVDFSTGNIDFPGSVHIRGDVSNGFYVRAGGDIVVNGVVENATLVSGGSIALCSGIKGGGSGCLEAKLDVRTLFIESCKAKVGGNIYADTILNSTVVCGGLVSVFGKRGYLLGGVCEAGEAVSAVQIGNEANTPTTVVLNSRIGLSAADGQLSAQVSRYYDAVDRLERIAAEDAQTPEREAGFPAELARIAILGRRLERQAERILEEHGKSGHPRRRRTIQVLEALYPNVSMEIDGVSAKNTSLRGRCTVREREQKLYFAVGQG